MDPITTSTLSVSLLDSANYLESGQYLLAVGALLAVAARVMMKYASFLQTIVSQRYFYVVLVAVQLASIIGSGILSGKSAAHITVIAIETLGAFALTLLVSSGTIKALDKRKKSS